MSLSDTIRAKRAPLLAELLRITTQLNELTYPARLPPELLAEIFMQIYACHSWVGRSDDILAVAQVCRRWREVAVQHPFLWAHIETDRSIDYIKMMLERSKSCLLDISDVDSYETLSRESAYALIWPHFHRVRSLLVTHHPPFAEIPSAKLYAPQLRMYIEDYDLDTYGSNPTFLARLDAPRLRHVKLMSPSTRALYSESLTKLTHLEFLWNAYESGIRPFEDVMSILASLPRLSTLRIAIQFCLWQRDLPVPVSLDCPIVLFQHLQHLEFVKPCDVVGAGLFLEHAIFSSAPRIVVATDDEDSGCLNPRIASMAHSGVRSILSRSLSGCSNRRLHLRLIDLPRASNDVDLGFSVSTTASTQSETIADVEEDHLLCLTFPCCEALDIYDPLLPFCSNIRFLTISAHRSTQRVQAFQQMLGQLNNVEVVTITKFRNQCSSFCRLNGPDATQTFVDLDEVFTTPDGTALLPRLVVLQLTDIDISGRLGCRRCERRGSQICSKCKCTLDYSRLVQWLTKRCKLGLRLARLVIKGDTELVWEYQVMELQELVTDEVVVN